MWHPWSLYSVLCLIGCCCFVYFFSVDKVCILYDANLISCNLTDNTDTKSWTWEWLAVYKELWKAKLKTCLTNLILEKVAKWLYYILEIDVLRKSSYIVVRLDYCRLSAET